MAVLLASQLCHESAQPDIELYNSYLHSRTLDLHVPSDAITIPAVRQLRRFLNYSKPRYQSSDDELLDALRTTWTDLQLLADTDILTIDFGQFHGEVTTTTMIERAFNIIASCGPRYERIETSKILHLLQPELFVPWTVASAQGYGIRARWDGFEGSSPAWDYAHRFLPRMQLVASRAVSEYLQRHGGTQEEAVTALCQCGHTLAKVLEEFNYVKFHGGR